MPSNRSLFLSHLAQTSAFPLMLEIEKGKGLYLYGPDGQRWMDLIAGIGVSALGHCHPNVVRAIKQQADKYLHTMVYGEYVLQPQVALASAIGKYLPASLQMVYLTNSGAEATEGAMKLAKRFTGRYELLSCKNAYHGSTQGAASLMSDPTYTNAFRPLLPGIGHIRFNDFGSLDNITSHTAAVVTEVVQAEAGIIPAESAWLRALRDKCDQVGALLVFDEAQTGFGRTGKLWGFEHSGVVPDILLLAKGMGGGMPIGAFIASREIMASLSEFPILGHITTFGGHPVSSAAALATLETLMAGNLVEQTIQKGKYFAGLLRHSKIKNIRQIGLWLGVELSDFDEVQSAINYCLHHGLIVDWFLFNQHTIRIAPPLTITKKQIREAAKIILEALDQFA